MISVFRFEDPKGNGLYSSPEFYPTSDLVIDAPAPTSDPGLDCVSHSSYEDYYFGFASVQQVRRWLTPEGMQEAYAYHVRCYEYQLDDPIEFGVIFVGMTQVMFRKNLFHRVRCLALNELLPTEYQYWALEPNIYQPGPIWQPTIEVE